MKCFNSFVLDSISAIGHVATANALSKILLQFFCFRFIIDQIALAIQSNANLIALIVIIGAVAGTIYVFGRRLINWFRGFMG